MKRFWSVLLLAALLATSGVALGSHGSFERGYVAPGSPVTWRDFNRGAQLASRMVQDVLAVLFRSAASTPQAVCDDTGFRASAGTGFNIDVAAGTCFYPLATTDPYSSGYAVLKLRTAEAATSWAANPVSAGTVVYYVHVTPAYTITDGVEVPDPRYLVNTAASAAGYLTVASVSIDSTDANAAAYTYTDLRTIANSTHFAPESMTFGGDLDVAGSVNAEGDLTVGPAAGPAVATIAAATGDLDIDGDFTPGTVTGAGWSVGATGALDALTVSTGGGTAVDVSGFFDDVATGGSGLATAGQVCVADGAAGIAWGAVEEASIGSAGEPVGSALIADGAGGAAWGAPDFGALDVTTTGAITSTGAGARIGAGTRSLTTTSTDYAMGASGDVASADAGVYTLVAATTTSVARAAASLCGSLLVLFQGHADDDPAAVQSGIVVVMEGNAGAGIQRGITVQVTADPPEYSLYAEAGEVYAGDGLEVVGAVEINSTTITGDLTAATLALTHAADPTGGGADAQLYVAYVDGAWMGALQCVNSTAADAVIATSDGGGAIVEHSATPAGFPVHVAEAGTAGQRLVANNTVLGTDIHVALSNGRILTIHHDAGAGAMPAAYFDSDGGTVAQRVVFLSATAASTTHDLNPRRELAPLRP